MIEHTDLFCRHYAHWKAIGHLIFENEAAYALWNLTPAVSGHALVIPKSHVEDFTELHGTQAQDFLHAISNTFLCIQQRYGNNPKYLRTFYYNMLTEPPGFFAEYSFEFMQNIRHTLHGMLSHAQMLVKPISYNLGMNCGVQAGQRIPHLHIHLFPRRDAGLGVVAAMRHHLHPT